MHREGWQGAIPLRTARCPQCLREKGRALCRGTREVSPGADRGERPRRRGATFEAFATDIGSGSAAWEENHARASAGKWRTINHRGPSGALGYRGSGHPQNGRPGQQDGAWRGIVGTVRRPPLARQPPPPGTLSNFFGREGTPLPRSRRGYPHPAPTAGTSSQWGPPPPGRCGGALSLAGGLSISWRRRGVIPTGESGGQRLSPVLSEIS